MTSIAKLSTVVIDCADPATLAEFYRTVTGGKIIYSDADYTYVDGGSAPIKLGFQRIANYQPSGWPDDRKRFHLEFAVPELEATEKELLAIGATKPEFQPGDGSWVVLADPEGHVFCLITSD